MFFKKHIMEIIAVGAVLLLIICMLVLSRHADKKGGQHQLSKSAQVVRDYLDGKEVKGNEAWWLNMPSGHDVSLMADIVALELKLDGHYVSSQIRLNNFSLVYRPEKKQGKK